MWGRGVCGFAEFCERGSGSRRPPEAVFEAPKPQAIPARERRRAGLAINLAVAVAHEACEYAGVDKSQVPSVFVSAMGDTEITDYMCRKLAQSEKLLSPTRFHNSVHNAPAGYWSISAENRAPSTFVGGYHESFGAGLLEAASQALAATSPVLLVGYDIHNPVPFETVTPIAESLACALVVAPREWAVDHAGVEDFGAERFNVTAGIDLVSGDADACVPRAPALAELAAANPMGIGLTLLEQVVAVQGGAISAARVQVPAANRLWLDVSLGAGECA